MATHNGHRRAGARRHCMVVHAHYPLSETRVERQAHALVAHGYEVDVICLRGDGEAPQEMVDGVRVTRLPVKRDKRRGTARQLLEYLVFCALAFVKLLALYPRRRYGVVQVHNLPDFLVFAALGPKLAGARVILDIHDLMPEFFAASFGTGLSSRPVRLLRTQERLACRFADHVVTVTEHWRQALIARGVPAGKVLVVMNVADAAIFRRLPAPKRAPGDGLRLIYHGALTERYGLDLVLRAVDRLRGRVPGIHATIHGGGEYLGELRALAEGLKLNGHVRFSTDFVPTAELPGLIRQADVAVVPYRRDLFTDGILPTKLMEYVALGVPVVAARTPAIASYFDDTMVRYFTPGSAEELAEALYALHCDRVQLAELARNADRFAEQYNWATVARGYVALVDHLNNR